MMMSEEAELRDCDEAFESEEGDVEPYLEEGESSRELLERLRELEAENSALALANESQREAYERCLDEVANHVVQALLNQKDLREECIKLKMRVFDLERQNRTLSELFHQKIHNQPGHTQLIPTGLIPEHSTGTPPTGSDRPAEPPCDMPAKSTGDHTKNGTPGTQGPAASMEALSPFFKKKAHILEVLRKLEETDPLKFHPSLGLSSYCDLSQALAPAEIGLTSVGFPLQHKAGHQPHCRHSCSESNVQEHASGRGPGPDDSHPRQESCQACLILSQKNLDSLLKCSPVCGTSQPVENLEGLQRPEAKGVSAQSTDSQSDAPPAGGTGQPRTHSTSTGGRTSPAEHRHKEHDDHPQLGGADSHICSLIKDTDQNGPTSGVSEEPSLLVESQSGSHHNQERCCDTPANTAVPAQCKLPSRDADAPPLKEDTKHTTMTLQSLNKGPVMETTEECYFKVAADVANVKNSLYAATSNLPVPVRADSTQIAYCEQEAREQICNGLYFSSNESCISKKVAVESYSPADLPEKSSVTQPPPAGKGKLMLSPTSSSCLSEVKASPISSPSRLLKFLKIPSIGDRAQGTNPLRLSPQLTRSSKIPCRNNYEVYHSPAVARKATTTERDRQPLPSKTDPYPATHSAPTSPPKPEDACSPPAKEMSYSSHSAPKASRGAKLTPSSQPPKGFQKAPLYENVSDFSVNCPGDGDEPPQFLERLKASRLVPFPRNEDPMQQKRQSSLDEGLLSADLKQHNLSLATDRCRGLTTMDQDTYKESDVWYPLHSHHSLPDPAAIHKAQTSCGHSSMKDRQHDTGSSDTIFPSSELAIKGSDPPSVPKKMAGGKHHSESGHHPFKERLAALGKLKSTEDLQVGMQLKDTEDTAQWNECKSTPISHDERSKTAERLGDRNPGEHRPSKYTDSLDGKPYQKTNLSGYAGKASGPCLTYEPGAKSLPSSSSVTKAEQEAFTSRMYVAKTDSPKVKAGPQSSNPDPPQVLRNYVKCATTQNLPHNCKTAPSPQSSPTKGQSKSPSKPGQASSNPRAVKPIQDDRAAPQKFLSKSEDRSKLTANKKKISTYSESLPPPPPRPTEAEEDKRAFVPGAQSAIEQKVMKGIEENVLKLQEQDRGQVSEVKQKASNGIASWFGLRKSKLPALSRKPDTAKPKEDRKEWRLVSSSAGRDPKAATKKKLEVESLNISKLMEKAEDLRKALEEERAYVNGVALDRPGRGHSCEVVMNQAQGQLSVMYRGVASDNFMQQLLNRVDVRDSSSVALAHRRLSFDSKKSRPVFSQQRNGIISHAKSREEIEKGSDLVSKDDVTADESLAESINSQHFAGCSASTHTLDSGIGTFPLPDYGGSAAGKSIPKVKPRGERDSSTSHGKPGSATKVPRKARTLERELTSLEEDCPREKELNPSGLYGPALESRGPSTRLSSTIREDDDNFDERVQSPPSKNWTFPNLKVSADPTEVYLGVTEEVEPTPHGTPFRRSLKPCGPPGPCEADPASLSLPSQAGFGRRGKGRTPSAPEVGKEVGLELPKDRQEDVLSPIRPQVLETPESLSDSLYDSLSSCGSQG